VKLPIDTLNGVGVFETGPIILLPSGEAFVIGGAGKTAIFTPGPHGTDPGSWTQGPVFPKDTSASPNWPTLTALDAPACLLPSGKVVCLAGTTAPDAGDYFSLKPIFLEYDPHSAATTLPPLDAQASLPAGNYTWQSCFLLLPTGQLLCSAQSNSLFLYTPDPASGSPHHSWRPANISVHERLVPGHSYRLFGTQINGLSQAVSYGDDAGMATNYPIVRLTKPVSGHVVYLRSYNFSTMGVATGSKVPNDLQSCRIDVPSNMPTGEWNLVVIANGIASDAVAVQIGTHFDERRFVGKVESLNYDTFGDFESFTLQTMDGETRRFESREPHVEELVRRAWQDRTRVKVMAEAHQSHRPSSISFLV